MEAEKHIAELIKRLEQTAGSNLVCVALFGSAVSQEFHADYSDINILCIFRELSAAALAQLVPIMRWWTGKQFPAPLMFSQVELERSADVFAIELMDICQRHRMLHGEDIFINLQVPMDLHRVQVENNLRTKLLTLRQLYAQCADDDQRVRRLMLDSVSNFATLFRHTLIAMGEKPAQTRADNIQMLAARLHFDPVIFLQLLQVRAKKAKESAVDPGTGFAQYLEGINKAVLAIDAL